MAHKTSGTFALSRLADENKEVLIKEFQDVGMEVQLDKNKINATITGNSEDFKVARARYNEYIIAAQKEELKATNQPTSHLPSEKTLQDRTREAMQLRDQERDAVGGTLLANPAEMQHVAQPGVTPREMNEGEVQARFGEQQSRPADAPSNLPANSPPGEFTPPQPEPAGNTGEGTVA